MKSRNPWGRKIPVHGNVEPELAAQLDDLRKLYGLKSKTEALNLVIAEGLAVYEAKLKPKKGTPHEDPFES